jgi:hypothetical protein
MGQEHSIAERPDDWKILNELNMPDHGYIVVTEFQDDYSEIFIRKVGTDLKIVGVLG